MSGFIFFGKSIFSSSFDYLLALKFFSENSPTLETDILTKGIISITSTEWTQISASSDALITNFREKEKRNGGVFHHN